MNVSRIYTTTVLLALVALGVGCQNAEETTAPTVPSWAQGAVFYQVFPERFRNGDPNNDPTFASLEWNSGVPETWELTPWTGDWYKQAPWEQTMGAFYEGVFHRRYGGDLQGVIDKLDYLSDLGVTALYFNPVFYARSLHKYDGNSFHHVDPYFGPDPEGDLALMASETSDPATWHWTKADELFLSLVRQAHDRGIRVIIDGVFNHTGRDFFAFEHLRLNQADSPYASWYMVSAFDDPETPENEFAYKGWWDVHTLPEFADTPDGLDLHPGPKAYIFDATRRWMDPNGDGDPYDGIDGWRLDVANEVPIGFWADWNALVRELNPQAYTVTELWDDAVAFLEDGGFSATMNYHGFSFPVKGFLVDEAITPSTFVTLVQERSSEYGKERLLGLQNLIDSHDTDRIASMIVNAGSYETYNQPDKWDYDDGAHVSPRFGDRYLVRGPNETERRKQLLVMALQMAWPGAPMIYYGTEAGMWGGDDPDDRKPMVWPDLSFDEELTDPLLRPRSADRIVFDTSLHEIYRTWMQQRSIHPSLRIGEQSAVATNDTTGTMAFLRSHATDTTYFILNRGSDAVTYEVPASMTALIAATDPEQTDFDVASASVMIPARAAVLLANQIP